MSNTTRAENHVERQAVDLILRLIQCFRSKHKMDFDEISRLFFGKNQPGLEEERELVWNVIDLLHTSNPQVSPRLIFSLLISEVVGIVVFDLHTPITDEDFSQMAMEKIGGLLNYSSIRGIDIPVANLDVDGPPVSIGQVAFHPLSERDWETDWWEKITLNYSGNPNFEVRSFARVLSPGDWEIAIDYAENAVEEGLLIVRGLGFPFTTQDLNQFGIINEFPVWPNKPYRLNKPEESIAIDSTPKVITRLGPGIRVYRLHADLLKGVDRQVITTLSQLLGKKNDNTISRMQSKFLSGLRWIGEATRPDALAARYLKLSTAMEFLIGGDASDEYLSTRGITATLAERAAFILGRDQDDRVSIDRQVKKFYGLRSKIVHGSRDAIDQSDFLEFGLLTRQIALAYCMMVSDFDKLDDLQRWVVDQRYA